MSPKFETRKEARGYDPKVSLSTAYGSFDPRRLGLDLDGTLFDTPGVNYDDPASVRAGTRPIESACAWVHEYMRTVSGASVVYISDRSEPVRAETETQIKRWLPAGPLYLQSAWQGYEIMTLYKADVLVDSGCAAYVGDHAADEAAARFARVLFVDAACIQRAGAVA